MQHLESGRTEAQKIFITNICAMSQDPITRELISMPVDNVSAQRIRWCFTWNNYPEQAVEILQSLFHTESLRHLVIGQEVAPETGTPHLQGYLELKKKTTLAGIKKLLRIASSGFESISPITPDSIHWEWARGTAAQNLTYCSKELLICNLGKPVKERERTDLNEIKELIDAGASSADIAENYFSQWVQYRNGFREYKNMAVSRGTRPVPKVYVWHGPTRTGKTRRAFDLAANDYDDSVWVWPGNQWFDGYDGQRVVIFDEFHGGSSQGITFPLWKKLTDRYRLNVQVKGGFVPWNPEVIIFTSNVRPQAWWPDEADKPIDWKDQFDERITEIELMNIRVDGRPNRE